MAYYCKIIEDSISGRGIRLTTMELSYPRFILPELNTHRVFSRSTASCLTGDTIVYIDSPAELRKGYKNLKHKMQIKDIVNKWINGDSRGRTLRHRLKEMNLRCFDEKLGTYINTKIVDCFKQGVQEVFEITLINGYKLKCTKKHRILSKQGWFTLEDLNIVNNTILSWDTNSYEVVTNGFNLTVAKYYKIKDIKYIGIEETYDLEVEGPYHNFVANGIVVHNSRAIPFIKMVEGIKSDPVIPVFWGKNKSGMQADEEISSLDKILAEREWLAAKDSAIKHAEFLAARGVHKQVVNRILEPFMYVKTIVTATEWDNFFTLRCHKDAQPEIRVLAEMMREEHSKSVPITRNIGEWHLPYISEEERANESLEDLKKMSAARCARVSYLNHDGNVDKEKDFILFDRLYNSRHASPMEHQATPYDYSSFIKNFRGWDQFRSELEL